MEYSSKFWESLYYKKNKITLENSSFSDSILGRLKPGEKILDVCSGNGRDSIFFKEKGLIVYSFDAIFHENIKDTGIHHKRLDLVSKSKYFNYSPNFFEHVYCRFVLHSIPEDLEDYILTNANWCLKEGGLFYIEARSDKGFISEKIDKHYRRLINIESLKNKLKNLNFEIIEQKEDSGLSNYKKDNPVLIRITARKKKYPIVSDPYKFMEIRIGSKYINKKDASELLLRFKKVMDINGLDFYLVFGTLLGAYRDKDFITHDKDIDVCLLEENRSVFMDLITSGIFSMYGIKVIRFGDELISLGYNETYLDVYLFDEKMDFYRCDAYIIDKNHISGGKNYIEFIGENFLTLNNIEWYLMEHYGDDWKTPIENKHAQF